MFSRGREVYNYYTPLCSVHIGVLSVCLNYVLLNENGHQWRTGASTTVAEIEKEILGRAEYHSDLYLVAVTLEDLCWDASNGLEAAEQLSQPSVRD